MRWWAWLRPGLPLWGVLVALSVPTVAMAGNHDEFPVGNAAAVSGGAAVAQVRDGSATFYNPAGLAHIDRDTFDVSASAYSLRYYSVPGYLRSAAGARKDAMLVEFIAAPTQVSHARRLGKGLAAGVGFFIPQASAIVLRERLVARGPEGTSRWSFDERVARTGHVIGAALGLELGPRLRLGGGLYGIYEEGTDTASIFGAFERGGETARVVQLSVFGSDVRFAGELGLGVQWELTDALTLAANLRGPRLQLYRSNSETLSEVDGRGDGSSPPMLNASSIRLDDADHHVGLLGWGRYHLAGAYRWGALSVTAEYDLQPAVRSSRTAARRAFTWNARTGLRYQVDADTSLGAGMFTDRASEPRSAKDSFIDFYGATVGVVVDSKLGLSGEARAESLVLSTAFALRYAYGFGRNQSLRVDALAPADAVFDTRPTDIAVHEFALHVGSGLAF